MRISIVHRDLKTRDFCEGISWVAQVLEPQSPASESERPPGDTHRTVPHAG